jgi:hypothetical protein
MTIDKVRGNGYPPLLKNFDHPELIRQQEIDPGRFGIKEVDDPPLLINGWKRNAYFTQILGVEMRLGRSRLGEINLIESRLTEQAIRNVPRMRV